MKLQMIGCSHHDAAVEFREKISFTSEEAGKALGLFRERFPSSEIVLLSTCNRVELYTTSDDQSLVDKNTVASFLAEQQGLSVDEVIDQMIYRSGNQAVEHLFTVASSLDSMVVGEAQILSQVKQAYDLACTWDSVGPLTHGVFQAANRAAKRVQQETDIHRRRVSVPSVAVGEVATEIFDHLADKRIVLCGAGEMGQETLRYLKQAGANNICVLNRNYDRAIRVAESFDATSDLWDSLDRQMLDADLVIGTTSATEPILELETFQPIHAKRGHRLLLILDLAVPRDFDPRIGKLANVYLYGIDDLRNACERNQREREKEWPKAKTIIAEETDKFMQALNHRATGPVIQRLREQAHELKQDELERLINKLKLSEMNPVMVKEIEKSFDRLINKLLHPPLASVRDDAAEGHSKGLLEALRHLFNLGD
ncbi:MAG: glutamyl-tRNA reductase [Rubripirellula sp.]|nr:glutamyl-tRNA reductase [Rubripirellula sp.]